MQEQRAADSNNYLVSRRNFLKGILAVGGSAAFGGAALTPNYLLRTIFSGKNVPKDVVAAVDAGFQSRERIKQEILEKFSITVLDNLVADPEIRAVADSVVRDYALTSLSPVEWMQSNLDALRDIMKIMPKQWAQEIADVGGMVIFLFREHQINGFASVEKTAKGVAVAFGEHAADTTTIGQYAMLLDVSHEFTHVFTMKDESTRQYWHQFITSNDGLHIQQKEDGSLIPSLDHQLVGYAKYGFSSWYEFIAVASSLYTLGRDAFESVYMPLLKSEQIQLLYAKLKSELFFGIEYKTTFLAQQTAGMAREYIEFFNKLKHRLEHYNCACSN